MEWIFLFLFVTIRLFETRRPGRTVNYALAIIVASLAIQTFWLLPELNERADQIINGIIPPLSSIHILYGIVEVIKVILLFFVAWVQAHCSTSGHTR